MPHKWRALPLVGTSYSPSPHGSLFRLWCQGWRGRPSVVDHWSEKLPDRFLSLLLLQSGVSKFVTAFRCACTCNPPNGVQWQAQPINEAPISCTSILQGANGNQIRLQSHHQDPVCLCHVCHDIRICKTLVMLAQNLPSGHTEKSCVKTETAFGFCLNKSRLFGFQARGGFPCSARSDFSSVDLQLTGTTGLAALVLTE